MPCLTTIRSIDNIYVMAFSNESGRCVGKGDLSIDRTIEHVAGPGNLAGQDLESAPKTLKARYVCRLMMLPFDKVDSYVRDAKLHWLFSSRLK
jgi:hypothetical protein